MNRVLMAAACCLPLTGPAAAMSSDDCTLMWKTADTNSDGMLNGAEADRYSAAMRTAGKTFDANGTMNEAAFMDNCKADVFAIATAETGAPLKGANSFTEGQAKDWIMAAGFTDVSALAKDADGIWRGTASKGGKSMNVAVDYKGNVVGS